MNRFVVLCLVFFWSSLASQAGVIIADFSDTNPLTSAYSTALNASWSNPTQFRSFTDGAVCGQEVLSIAGL